MYVYVMYDKNDYAYIPSLRMRELLVKYLNNEL